MVGLTTLRRVLVAGIGVPKSELVAVAAAESDRSGGHSQEDALETLRLEFEATAEQIPLACGSLSRTSAGRTR